MEKFWKSMTLHPRPGQAGAPQPSSDAADTKDNWAPIQPKHQQTTYGIKSGLKPLKLVSDSDKSSLPSILRANTVKVEPWSERNREFEVNKVKPTRRCRFPLLPMTRSQGSVKPQVAEDPVAATQEPNRNLPGAHVQESLHPKPQKRPMTGISGLKPLKPVAPQYPSISQCIGIVPGPKLERIYHQPAPGTARVFRRFNEVLLEEPPRVERRTSKQRSAFVNMRWQQQKGGGLLDEHLETAADSKVPGCSSEAHQPEMKRFGLQTGCVGSPARSHLMMKPCKGSLVADESSECGQSHYINVIITYKDSNVLYPKLKDRLD